MKKSFSYLYVKKRLFGIHRFAVLFFSLLLIATAGQTQSKEKEDTTYVNTLLTQSKSLFGENPSKAIDIAQQAYDVAQRLKFQKGAATALKNIGVGYYYQQKYVEALDYWNQSLKLFEQMDDEVGVSNLLNNIGAVYMDKGDDVRALEYCFQALKVAEKIQDKERIMACLANVASIYHNKNDPRAIDYLLKALPLAEEAGNKEATSVLLGNIGEVYYDQKDDNKASLYFGRAIATKSENASLAFAYNGIGKVNLRRNSMDEALRNHLKALDIAEKVGDKMQSLRALKGLANVYLQKKQYPVAFDYYNKAKDLGEEIDAKVELKDIYQEMAAAYLNTADYKNALLYKSKYADIKDTLYNSETAKKVGKLQFDFDMYKKEGEIKLLTQEKVLNESKLKVMVAALILILFVAVALLRMNKHKQKAYQLLQRQKAMTDEALDKLKATQAQLIQKEKMASLGEVTAGVAHEIQNPLNFINNFSELSTELINEMEEMLQQNNRDGAIALAKDVEQNLKKIAHHGSRADAIVKGMLEHSNKREGVKELTDINALVDEFLKIAFHSFRAKNDSVSVVLETHYDPSVGSLNVSAQDIGRVLLNLYNNAFYAVVERKKRENGAYEPVVSISTKKEGATILINVSDNGTGIKQQLIKKVFQPFFTTKPAGEGIGMGLSLSYDIITKGHGGELMVESQEGEGAEFSLILPRQ